MRRYLFLFSLALACSGGVGAAECVYPAKGVVTGVTVRARATADSAALGVLRPGEKLPWVSTAAGWYEVHTGTGAGQRAFVSKRWTDVAACVEAGIAAAPAGTPVPLLRPGHPVDWWFVFKFNASTFAGCAEAAPRACPFGGAVQSYKVGQQYVYASSENRRLQKGGGCVGATLEDPVGSTFDPVFTGQYHYVVWNDQFKGDPRVAGCGEDCASPWGHSKGMVAWNDAGAGFVMQVTTPSWPGAGSQETPRQSDGNTLGCAIGNNVKYSQHFFALKLTRGDLVRVLRALDNASVATDIHNPQIVRSGGPADVTQWVSRLGDRSDSTAVVRETLSTGVQVISKPSKLRVPPWQLVSAMLGGVSLRTATWWAAPQIPSTAATTPVGCWSAPLPAPGAVAIATTGQWQGTAIGLKGFVADGNHAKVGVSTAAGSAYSIFGDLNQQGTLNGPNCGSSQNGRGGLFFVVRDGELTRSVGGLIEGDSAPLH